MFVYGFGYELNLNCPAPAQSITYACLWRRFVHDQLPYRMPSRERILWHARNRNQLVNLQYRRVFTDIGGLLNWKNRAMHWDLGSIWVECLESIEQNISNWKQSQSVKHPARLRRFNIAQFCESEFLLLFRLFVTATSSRCMKQRLRWLRKFAVARDCQKLHVSNDGSVSLLQFSVFLAHRSFNWNFTLFAC